MFYNDKKLKCLGLVAALLLSITPHQIAKLLKRILCRSLVLFQEILITITKFGVKYSPSQTLQDFLHSSSINLGFLLHSPTDAHEGQTIA